MVRTRLLPAVVLALAVLAVAAGCNAFGGSDESPDGIEERTEDLLEGTPTATGIDSSVEPPEEALERWVQNRLGVGFVADCGEAERPDDIGKQCARLRGERADMLAYELGPVFAEYVRLIVLQRVGDSWTIARLETRDPNAEDVPGVPWPLEVGAQVIVVGTEPQCLRIRERAGVQSQEIACLDDGTLATIVEGPVGIDEFEWWRLEGYGWAASNWLRYPEDVPEVPTIEPDAAE